MPEVATAPSSTCSVWIDCRVSGWRTSTSWAPPTRRSPPQSTAQRPSSRFASRSAARPLPVPPVSRRSPGGRRTVSSVSATRRHSSCGSGLAGARCGDQLQRVLEGELRVAAGAVVADRLQLRDERRVDEAVRQLRGQQPGGDRGVQQRRRPGPPRAGPRSGGRARCRDGSGSASRRSARGTRGTRRPRPVRRRTVVPMQSKVRSVMATVMRSGWSAAPEQVRRGPARRERGQGPNRRLRAWSRRREPSRGAGGARRSASRSRGGRRSGAARRSPTPRPAASARRAPGRRHGASGTRAAR